MLNRILLVVILVPLAIVLITLAVANRESVAFTLDPFHPGNPSLTLSLPFFVWLFSALGIGVLVGGFAAWVRQGVYRSLARRRGKEADRLREAAKVKAVPMAAPAPASPALAALPKPVR